MGDGHSGCHGFESKNHGIIPPGPVAKNPYGEMGGSVDAGLKRWKGRLIDGGKSQKWVGPAPTGGWDEKLGGSIDAGLKRWKGWLFDGGKRQK